MFRIGFGYDAHRLVEGRPLFLGGVEINHRVGLEGHSDADVLTHAIIDATIGALGRGDIGQHFPDTDPAYKGASSLSMLKTVAGWMKRDGYKLNNLDATLVAESPKMTAYIPIMRERVDKALEDSIRQHVKTKLEAHAYPREIEFLEEMPMTNTGKIMKKELRRREEKERARKETQ